MKSSTRTKFWLSLLILPMCLGGFVLVVIAWFLITTPDVLSLSNCITTSMHQVKLCSSSSNYVSLGNISPYAVNAILASEDSAFYSHQGFDWHEIRESFETNLSTGKFKRGGSTISQQLVKNVFLTEEKTLLRKIREAYLTYQLEKNFTKSQILEKYLNVVEFGYELYGIKAAAQHYFQKSPAQLNVLESSFLAFLLPNPKGYSVSFRKGVLTPFARQRIKVILTRLYGFKKISREVLVWGAQNISRFPWLGLDGPANNMTNASDHASDQPFDNDEDNTTALEDDDVQKILSEEVSNDNNEEAGEDVSEETKNSPENTEPSQEEQTGEQQTFDQ